MLSFIITGFFLFFLDQRHPGPIKSVLLVRFGWLVGWSRTFLRNGTKDFSDSLHEVRGL